jgi:hypothetical protein
VGLGKDALGQESALRARLAVRRHASDSGQLPGSSLKVFGSALASFIALLDLAVDDSVICCFELKVG